MRRIIKLIVVILFIITFTIVSFAEEKIQIGLGNFEPHFFEDSNSGIFTDIIKEVFKLLPQYEIEYVHNISNARLVAFINSGEIDAAANIFEGENIEGYKSDPIFRCCCCFERKTI